MLVRSKIQVNPLSNTGKNNRQNAEAKSAATFDHSFDSFQSANSSKIHFGSGTYNPFTGGRIYDYYSGYGVDYSNKPTPPPEPPKPPTTSELVGIAIKNSTKA